MHQEEYNQEDNNVNVLEEYKYQEIYNEDKLRSFSKKQLANILADRNINLSSIATIKNALHARLDKALLDKED